MAKTDLLKKIGRYQGNISCKDRYNKGQKWQEPNGSRRGGEDTQKNCSTKL